VGVSTFSLKRRRPSQSAGSCWPPSSRRRRERGRGRGRTTLASRLSSGARAGEACSRRRASFIRVSCSFLTRLLPRHRQVQHLLAEGGRGSLARGRASLPGQARPGHGDARHHTQSADPSWLHRPPHLAPLPPPHLAPLPPRPTVQHLSS